MRESVVQSFSLLQLDDAKLPAVGATDIKRGLPTET